MYYEEFLIIKSLLNGKCLLLRGVLGLSDMNTKSESQHFYLRKVNLYEPKKLRNALILFNLQDKDKEKAFLSLNKEKEQISYSNSITVFYRGGSFSRVFMLSIRKSNKNQTLWGKVNLCKKKAGIIINKQKINPNLSHYQKPKSF